MKAVRVAIGQAVDADLVGAVLTRDLILGEERWSKGRRLSAADLDRLASTKPEAARAPGLGRSADVVTLLVPGPGDIHEDEAATRLAGAVRGPGLTVRGPNESRVDLLAEWNGIVHVRNGALAQLNQLDPLEVFTLFEGTVVSTGELVASVKVAPHVVAEATVRAGERLARAGRAIVSVAPFLPKRIAVIVRETIAGAARERFERSVRAKVDGLGSTLVPVVYVSDDPAAVATALRAATRGKEKADIVLVAGAASTDPLDPVFVALEDLGGQMVRQGVPAHPGSMLWLARLGGTPILGLPTCGAFSKATAVDLLLPRLVSGAPATALTVAHLSHGGILTRGMRFRFPPYARDLEDPTG